MNQVYAGTGHPARFSGCEGVTAAPIPWHEGRSDMPEVVRQALRGGALGTARLRLMQLNEPAQAEVMQRLPIDEAVRLARGLSNYSLATICERLPDARARAILRSLPDFKRRGVNIIRAHRRHL